MSALIRKDIRHKIQIITLSFFVFLFLFKIPSEAAAALPWNAQNQSNFTSQTLQHGIMCDLVFMSPIDKCVGMTPKKDGGVQIQTYAPQFGGALGNLTNFMVALYVNPPTSSRYYLAQVGKGFGIISPAYAQNVVGSGAGIIAPVEKLWEVTRNISYLAFIIIFLAVGFMIMFRQKLNAQSVLSVQSALPSLVIGLILVTFSYFIAAFLIDLAFLSMQLIASLFIQNGLKNALGDAAGIQKLAEGSNLFDLFTGSFRILPNAGDIIGGVNSTLKSIFEGTPVIGNSSSAQSLAILIPAMIASLVALIVFPPAGWVALGITAVGGGTAGALAAPIAGLIIPLILIIALMIQFFKLFFKLLQSYIMLLVTTILGPLFILISAVPGKGTSLSFWWKNILGHALVFPSVFAVFLFGGMILATPASDWRATAPLFGGFSTELLRLIIAYGIILGTPAVPDTVKKLVGAGDLGEIGKTGAAGFFAGFGVGKGAGTAGVNRLLAPTMQMRNEYRTLQEQSALGKLGPLGESRLAALREAGAAQPERDAQGNITGYIPRTTWLPRQVQKWLTQTGNKPFSGKK